MNKLDDNSKIKDIYKNPVGHDILDKILLQLNKNKFFITNIFVRNLKMKWIKLITQKFLGEEFFDTLYFLLNSNNENIINQQSQQIEPKWWKEAVFYHIYPRSFKDSNGDGIGDLNGITSKLDYLKELGIDAIWLSPIYDSPNDDNGYDIRDYYKIMSEFGRMEDFERLLQELHQREMRLIVDLVLNHTSDEHKWFQSALNDENSKYRDYYFFRKNKDNREPNNWTSYFSGSAWNYYEEQEDWALHLFSKKQMDLNWGNEELRKELYKMVNWWLEKGVDGFRLDVINYISKNPELPNGCEQIGKLMRYYGVEHYFYGPDLHKNLNELRKNTFEPYQAFLVGETPGVGIEMAKLLTADDRKELDMIFSFDHLEMPGHVRFDDYQYDLNYLKKYYIDWMIQYGNTYWMSLFYENHDNPRMISKVNSDPMYREVLAKLLAMIQLTLKGTPFIYQGQEIGTVNNKFESIYEFRDVESINYYNELRKNMLEHDAFEKILVGSRDHARTPMQWNEEDNGGFTTGIPWILSDEDYKIYNVESQLIEDDSILNFYKKLIRFRKENPALIYGDVSIINSNRKDVFTYYRRLKNDLFYVECNIGKTIKKRNVLTGTYTLCFSNYEDKDEKLRPYEANLYKVV